MISCAHQVRAFKIEDSARSARAFSVDVLLVRRKEKYRSGPAIFLRRKNLGSAYRKYSHTFLIFQQQKFRIFATSYRSCSSYRSFYKRAGNLLRNTTDISHSVLHSTTQCSDFRDPIRAFKNECNSRQARKLV